MRRLIKKCIGANEISKGATQKKTSRQVACGYVQILVRSDGEELDIKTLPKRKCWGRFFEGAFARGGENKRNAKNNRTPRNAGKRLD